MIRDNCLRVTGYTYAGRCMLKEYQILGRRTRRKQNGFGNKTTLIKG